MTIVIIENDVVKCNFNATYSITLAEIPSFTAISSCIIDHIVKANSLTPAEKLYYLVNDFYAQSFKSWVSHSNKLPLNKSYSDNVVKFSATKIGSLLGFSRSKIFNIQHKLESLGYLHVNRSLNQYGTHNVNVTAVTLPQDIFSDLMFRANNKSYIVMEEGRKISAAQRRDIIAETKQFIPMNFDLFRFVFFHKHLSCSSKLLYIQLFSIIHKIKKKYNYPIYAGGLDYNTLLENCNISRSTLFRSLKQLTENGLIKCEKLRTESEDKSSNRFDKIINYIQILVPKELEHIFIQNKNPIYSNPHNSSTEYSSITEALNSAQNYENISEKDIITKDKTPVSKEYLPSVKRIPPILIYKNKQNIKLLDKDVLDKKEIEKEKINDLQNLNKLTETNKSISIFSKFAFSSKEKISENKSSENKQNKLLKKKSLLDFYPLSSDNCLELQRSSGKKYNQNAMNEILRSLTNKLISPIFYNKKGFMAYMTKIFKHEMRDPAKVNNASFKILANMSEEERKTYEIEKYLSQVENTPLEIITPEWHLKKKLACVLKRETAYELLKNYKSINIYGSKAMIELYRHVELTEPEKQIILQQIKATHERIGEGDVFFCPIEKIEFLMPPKRQTENINRKSEGIPRTGVWGEIRSTIAKYLSYVSSNGDAIDTNWFSKIEAEIDENTKQIILKAPSDFIKNYVFEKYQNVIEEASMSHGYVFRAIYTKGNACEVLMNWRKQNYS